MNHPIQRYNKKVLLAVDASENSRRAVAYVAQMLGACEKFYVILLHVINPPEENNFSVQSEQKKWLQRYRLKIESMLKQYRQILLQGGFSPQALDLKATLGDCPSVAECILAEQKRRDCSTIVVGRQGLSRSEEFLFGSVSSKLVSRAKDCTIWVVE